MLHEVTIEIEAPAERVWQVMTDIERWPEWTASIVAVQKLEQGPLRVGSRVRITQPRVPRVGWLVNEWNEGRSFAWESSSPALKSVAGHEVLAEGDSRSRVRLWVEQTGLFAGVARFWLQGLTREYLQMEAEGLKARAEGRK